MVCLLLTRGRQALASSPPRCAPPHRWRGIVGAHQVLRARPSKSTQKRIALQARNYCPSSARAFLIHASLIFGSLHQLPQESNSCANCVRNWRGTYSGRRRKIKAERVYFPPPSASVPTEFRRDPRSHYYRAFPPVPVCWVGRVRGPCGPGLGRALVNVSKPLLHR